MKKNEFIKILEELLERDPGTLKIDDQLESIPSWDSLALIGFIAMVDQNFGVTIPASRIINCKTVNDLALLVSGHVVD